MVDKTELGRIFWRSRRGLLELDLFLLPFAEHCYSKLPLDDRLIYQELLQADDPDLLDWLKQKSQPECPRLKSMVQRIISYAETH